MQPLLVATHNRHKTAEIASLLDGLFTVTDLHAHPHLPATEETGVTFVENATLKALDAARVFPGWVLADDSGLEVDALGGAPGVYSARYAGPQASDSDNRARLLKELLGSGASDWSARFRCTLVLAREGRVAASFDGTVEGKIIAEERGSGGFGYDALFVPEGHAATFGELPGSVKNALSHRGRALAQLREFAMRPGGLNGAGV
jgi:XTP/dITP diphosphohydrolase